MIRPVAFVEAMTAYAVARHPAPVDLRLDGNEGRAPDASLLSRLAALSPELLRRYPSARGLEEAIAARFNLSPASVVVTAGADDGLDRACRAALGPGREIVLPVPTFEMIDRYARAAGGGVRMVPWSGGAYPVDEVLGAIGEATTAIAIVSPNNPTGAVAAAADIERVARAAPSAFVLFDHAYAEFADEDLTHFALSFPNVVVFRTFSKAWGLAGLRVGYVLGPPAIIGWLRRSGQPYAVAAPSLALAGMRLEGGREDVEAFVARVREERGELYRELLALGHAPMPSQANFVLCAPADPLWLRDALAGLGVGVRAWPGHPELARYVRITCPGDPGNFSRLLRAIRVASRPGAIAIAEGPARDPALVAELSGRAPVGVAAGSSFADVARGLGSDRAWAIVETADEAREAKAAGLLAVGFGEAAARAEADLLAAGAARVLRRVESFGMLLP